MTKIRSVVPKHQLTSDEDHVVTLCLETVLNNHMVLVFCPTKNWCEKLAETIAREFANLAKQSLASTDGNINSLPFDMIIQTRFLLANFKTKQHVVTIYSDTGSLLLVSFLHSKMSSAFSFYL